MQINTEKKQKILIDLEYKQMYNSQQKTSLLITIMYFGGIKCL